MSIAAGRLRHRIEIQEYRYSGQDPETGEEIRSWEAVRKCWASIEPLSAREFIAAQATQSKVTARITIRFWEGLDASMRIVQTVRGTQKIFNIEGELADPESGTEYLTMPCSEGVNAGGQ